MGLVSRPGEIYVLRHGQTQWSMTGRHTGLSDIPLTALGEQDAARWAPELGNREFAAVFASPRTRAQRTAELAGLTVTETVEDLREWEYGEAEGRTTAQLRADIPGWDVWTDGPPGGESLAALGARVDGVLAKVSPLLSDGDVMLVAHGHVLRVLIARWMDQQPVLGSRIGLDPAALGLLGFEHDRQIARRLGVSPGGLSTS